MQTPLYTPIADQLPPIYKANDASFAQVDGYLGLLDSVSRAYVATIADATTYLSPLALSDYPIDVPLDGGREALANRYAELLDELVGWFSFVIPASWEDADRNLEKRLGMALRAARTWRRRGTPRGFADWFSFYFDVETDDRPILLEHYKYGTITSGSSSLDPWLRATLLVPSTPQFNDAARRAEVSHFVDRYAPAHVHMRLCWVEPGFDAIDFPAEGASAAEITAHRNQVRDLLCTLVSFIDHGVAIHVRECLADGETFDRLGLGRLPGGGSEPDIG